MVNFSEETKQVLLSILEKENIENFPTDLKPYIIYDVFLFAFSEPDKSYKENLAKIIKNSNSFNELLERVVEEFIDDIVYPNEHKFLLRNKNFNYLSYKDFIKRTKNIFKSFEKNKDKNLLDIELKKLFTYSPKVYLLLYIYENLNLGIFSFFSKSRINNFIKKLLKDLEKFNSFEDISLYFRKSTKT